MPSTTGSITSKQSEIRMLFRRVRQLIYSQQLETDICNLTLLTPECTGIKTNSMLCHSRTLQIRFLPNVQRFANKKYLKSTFLFFAIFRSTINFLVHSGQAMVRQCSYSKGLAFESAASRYIAQPYKPMELEHKGNNKI